MTVQVTEWMGKRVDVCDRFPKQWYQFCIVESISSSYLGIPHIKIDLEIIPPHADKEVGEWNIHSS